MSDEDDAVCGDCGIAEPDSTSQCENCCEPFCFDCLKSGTGGEDLCFDCIERELED